jgi:hypothetical protein
LFSENCVFMNDHLTLGEGETVFVVVLS